jgi:hypothetical protein
VADEENQRIDVSSGVLAAYLEDPETLDFTVGTFVGSLDKFRNRSVAVEIGVNREARRLACYLCAT